MENLSGSKSQPGRSSRPAPGRPLLVLVGIFIATVALIVLAVYFGLLSAFIGYGGRAGADSGARAVSGVLLLVAPWVISLAGAAGAWVATRSLLPQGGKRRAVVVWLGIVLIALTPAELAGLAYCTVKSAPTIAALLDALTPGWNDGDEDWNRLQHVYQFENALYGNPPLEGEPNTTYVSIPDIDPNCSHARLPPLPTPGRYHCVPLEQLIEHDGTGWLPWRHAEAKGTQSAPLHPGPPRVDPRNQAARGLYYRFRMPSEEFWLLTVQLAREADFPSRFVRPMDRNMQLQRNGQQLVLSGSKHSRLPKGRDY